MAAFKTGAQSTERESLWVLHSSVHIPRYTFHPPLAGLLSIALA